MGHPLLVLGMSAWAGAALAWLASGFHLSGHGLPAAAAAAAATAGAAGLIARRCGRGAAALVVVGLMIGAVSSLSHLTATRPAVLQQWSQERASVTLGGVVLSCAARDPDEIGARSQVRAVATARSLQRGDRSVASRSPVVLRWEASQGACPPRGADVTVRGRMQPVEHMREPGLTVRVSHVVRVVPPTGWAAAVAVSRERMWRALSTIGPDAASLTAGLAVGDDSGQSEALGEAMRDSGLSHLTAVSGGNVAVVLGLVVAAASLCGASIHVRAALGAASVVAYAAYVGPEPSVLRASVMGAVAVVGTLRGGRRGGFSLLGLAVLTLIVVRPGLTVSWGFVLSVAATAGILALAPALNARLGRRAPGSSGPAVAAVAVTLAAQAATAPVIAAMTGTISWIAVPANLAAAPLVAPITVLGLAVAVVAVPAPGIAEWPAMAVEPFAALLASIANWAAGEDSGTLTVPSGAAGAAITAGALGIAVLLYRYRGAQAVIAGAACCAVLMWVVQRQDPPPRDWVAASCDIGQGDAFLVRTGPESAVLIDTGPDADALLRCLGRMGVVRIDLVVLTHFDTDHVAATPAVLERFRPAALLVSPVDLPAPNADAVRGAAREAGVPVLAARPGQRLTTGSAVIEVVWPRRVIRSGSVSNNAAVATSVTAAGLRMLFAGDLGTLGQGGLMASFPQGRFDVTTIPHHGSADQHPGFLRWTGADLAWVSAGRGNRFGHPRPEALQLAADAGAAVGRTDREGTLVLIARDGRPVLVALGPDR